MTKSKSPKSDAKRPTKSSKKAAEKRPATPKKAPKTPAKKLASKAKPRGRTAVFETPHEPAVPTIDTPPVAEVEKPRTEVIVVEPDADGREPIPGPVLVQALKYVHAVVPKEDGIVFYTHGADGEPLVSGHDTGASFTFFLAPKAVWELDAAVPRKDSVRVHKDGRAVIRHDTGQPEITFALGNRVITDHWQPPSKGARTQSETPLRMDAARTKKACAVPEAITRSWSSADGIEWIDVSNAETGTTLARAVIAEDGHDLYVTDPRQTEIGGSRTAGGANNSAKMSGPVGEAMRDLKDTLAQSGMTMTVKVPGHPDVTLGGEPAPEPTAAKFSIETDALDLDAPPVAPTAPTLPAPPENTTRLSLSAAQWTALDDDGRARLAAPESGAVIGWTERDGRFIADVPDDLVSLVRATGDELVVHFDDDTLDLGEKTEEPEAL